MNDFSRYLEDEKIRHIDELLEFLKIPSISSVPEHKRDVLNCAEWLMNNIRKSGIDDVRLIETPGHPIIFAQWNGAGENAKTVLIYGHYDVQPVDPLEEWLSEPFNPEIRNGKIFARGSADDKGQLFTHIKAIETYFKTKSKIPVNIKLLIEGEEEANMSNLDDFIKSNRELLSCDVALISDTEWYSNDLPSICYSLRGIGFIELIVTGPNRDLHSGSFGGAVDNPIFALCRMIAELKDEFGRVKVPGFYDNVLDLDKSEKADFAALPFDEFRFCEDIGIKSSFGEFGFSTLERIWARPAIDINGIYGGYSGAGSKTIIPSKAGAKITIRLVPNQDSADIVNKTMNYLKSIAPPTVQIELYYHEGGNPVLVARDSPAIKAAMNAIQTAFGKKPVFMREGGSIPVVGLFDEVLNAPVVLLGLGLPSDNIHSPNENFELNNYLGGIYTSIVFMQEFAK